MSVIEMRKDTRWFWTAASFFGGLLLALGIFAAIGLTPFGDRIFFMSDLSAQYMPFLAFFRDSLSQGEGWLYSFQNGIGGNMLPLIAYYLTSPLNLFLLPFSNADLPTGIHLLMALKLAAASGAMGLYLTRTYSRKGIMTVVFSAGYAFCGFTAAYFYNIMWLDALIWLPLVVLSLHLLVDKGRKSPYVFCLFMTIISNYYLGYMICLFLVLYVVYWTRKRQLDKPWRIFFRDNRQVWLTFIGCSLLAGMMTGILLAPTVLGMLATGKSEFDFAVFLPKILFGLDGFAGFGIAASTFTSRLNHLPTFYVGMLPLVLGATYFGNTRIKKAERKLLLGFLLILLVCIGLQTLVAVFQMFQLAAGFPFRNSFLFSFMFLTAAYESWNNREGISARLYVRAGIVLALGFIVAYFYNRFTYRTTGYPPLEVEILLLNLILVGLACSFLLNHLLGKRGRTFLLLVASAFAMLELGFNFLATMGGIEFGSQPAYQTYVQELQGNLEKVDDTANPLVRIDNTWLDAKELGVMTNGYNEGMHFGYNSVASYTSTLSSDVVDWFQKNGTFSRNERRFSYLGSTPLTDLLLNVGYSLSLDEGTIQLSENSEVRGMGFTVPQSAAGLRLENREPFENQNQLFQALFGGEQDVFLPVSQASSEQENTEGGVTHSFSLQAPEAGELYIWLPRLGGGDAYGEIQVAGSKVEPKLRLTNDSLLSLGEVAKGETIQVSMEVPRAAELSADNFQVFDTASFQQKNRDAGLQNLENIQWHRNELTGTVEATDDDLLFLSIPYEEGWRVTVNGRTVETDEVLGGFLGVPLAEGENVIRARYVPAGLRVGMALSLTALGLCAVWAVVPGWVRKKRGHTPN